MPNAVFDHNNYEAQKRTLDFGQISRETIAKILRKNVDISLW